MVGERRAYRFPSNVLLGEVLLVTPGAVFRSAIDNAKMVYIAEGPANCGARPGDIFAQREVEPGHVVWLSAFLIDKYPTTNEQFGRFVDDGGYGRRDLWRPEGWDWREEAAVFKPRSFETLGFDDPEQPVAGLSWYEASAYAAWAKKALPTEAQWEKAARGGLDWRRFPWGEALPSSRLCNFGGRRGATTPVGRYREGESPYGLADMSGNVNNWCRDWYWPAFYELCTARGLLRDPVLDTAACRMFGVRSFVRADRGGGYATSEKRWEVLSTYGRLGWHPTVRHLWNGLRCVIEPQSCS